MLPDDYDLPSFTGPTISFIVRYDPECEESALLFARRLFAELDERIEALTLIPGTNGEFEVWLDGDQIHSGAGVCVEPSARQSVLLAWKRLNEKERISLHVEEEESSP